MLDIKLIRENPEIIKKDLEKRDKLDLIKKVDEIRELDILWRENLQKVEKLKHQRNVLSREVAQLKKAGKDATEKLNLVKEIPKKIVDVEEKTDSIQVKIKKIMFQLPNILHDTVPVGADDTQNVSVKKWGKPRKDKTISHVDLLEKWDVGDTARGAKTSGSRFYFLKNELVMLDMALQKFGMDHMMNKGLIPMIPPYMLRREAYDAMTSMDDFEEVIYKIEDEDLYLIATSEHPIGAYHMNETIEKKDLPLKYAGISPCFRKEAGSHGKDTKGIFRVHQFHKIEQFAFSMPEDSWKIHEELLANAEELFQKLEIPYQIVNVCTGDMGSIAAKKYDLEVWMPAQQKYREAVSNSNCTDYQARRLNTKYLDGSKRDYVHTLNSTAFATSRVIVAIMENFQDED